MRYYRGAIIHVTSRLHPLVRSDKSQTHLWINMRFRRGYVEEGCIEQARLIDEANILCHTVVELLTGCIAVRVNFKAVETCRETSKHFSRSSQNLSVFVAPPGSLQDMPTRASLDCAVLPGVVSLGAT